MPRTRLLIILSVVAIALISGIGLFAADKDANAGLAMSEMSVTKLTCGACVANITNALSGVAGVESVEVSVTTGRSKVMYNPELVDAEKIAQVVTDTGYPATVTRQLSNEQYLAIQTEEAKLAEIYVAKIGDRLLGRDEFDQLVQQKMLSAGYQARPEMQAQIASQTWMGLKQRILLLGAAEKNQVVVQDGEVELRIDQMRQQMPNFESYISGFSSPDDFFRQTKEDMIINKNIQEHVLAGVASPAQRQVQFNQWFQNLINNSPVTIYDASLKQSAAAKGGCGSGSGGGCCG
ncbi:MAG TPA: cation transporter [Malonomonas sp.]